MTKFINWLVEGWAEMPPKWKVWIKGAEVTVFSALITALLSSQADFSTTAGIAKFVSELVTVAYGALRLYLTRSPIPVAAVEVTALPGKEPPAVRVAVTGGELNSFHGVRKENLV